jgi:uncharacterized protein (TIGR03663 family)
VTIAALALRLPQLKRRPMHGDEAVHADKFGQLLENSYYHYNPSEYHGPTLNYFTLVPAWLSGAHDYKDVSEFTLRIVPVLFGVLLVLLLLLLTDGLGGPAACLAAVFTAVSPAFVFYSRYYIPEQKPLVGLTCRRVPGSVPRHQGDMYNRFWFNGLGVFLDLAYAAPAAWLNFES